QQTAFGRTFPGTPSSSVTPSLQTSPSTSKIEQVRWGNGRMVIVISKRSSSCLPCSNQPPTHTPPLLLQKWQLML
ncbi:unnamed protein product, partial [Bubo scandiacus]